MAFDFLNSVSEKFWSREVWLPPNVTWEDVKPTSTHQYAKFSDIFLAIPFSLGLTALRLLMERYIFFPLGIVNGLRPVRPWKGQAPENPVLENAYLQSRKGKLNYKQIQGLAKQLDWNERQVERWFRMRRMMDRPSKLVKFMECGWRFSYYLFAFLYGLWVLWDKPWFADILQCWYNLPFHEVTSDVWWYYMISGSCYWSLLFCQFRDVKRKDFWEMFIHHIATLALINLSWACCLHRVGTLVFFIHDCADIFLEAAKMTKYIKWQRTCDTLFAIFTVVWIVTRIGIFPLWILNSTCFEAKKIVAMYPAYYIFNGLLLVLLALHIIWTYFILKVLYRSLAAGQIEGDSRSSSSEDFSDETSKSGNSSASPASPYKRLPGATAERKNSK